MANSRGGLTTFKRLINPGEVSRIDVRGKFIRIKDAPSPVQLTVRSNQLDGASGLEYTLEMKKFEKWFSDLEYDEIVIDNSENLATSITVEIQAGYGDFVAEIISRTLAANSNLYTTYTLEQTILHHDIVPRNNQQILAENSQRKRAKVHVAVIADTSGSPSTIAGRVQFFAGATKTPSPSWDDTTGVAVIGRVAQYLDSTTDTTVNLIDLGELETESIDDMWVGLYCADPFSQLPPGDSLSLKLLITVMEELYTAA